MIMNKNQALELLVVYSHLEIEDSPIQGMRFRFPEDGSEAKAMRWLGFAQGWLVASDVYTLEECKLHSKLASAGVDAFDLSEACEFIKNEILSMVELGRLIALPNADAAIEVLGNMSG